MSMQQDIKPDHKITGTPTGAISSGTAGARSRGTSSKAENLDAGISPPSKECELSDISTSVRESLSTAKGGLSSEIEKLRLAILDSSFSDRNGDLSVSMIDDIAMGFDHLVTRFADSLKEFEQRIFKILGGGDIDELTQANLLQSMSQARVKKKFRRGAYENTESLEDLAEVGLPEPTDLEQLEGKMVSQIGGELEGEIESESKSEKL